MIKCELCNKEFKSIQALTTHVVSKVHINDITKEEYYDKYLSSIIGNPNKICQNEKCNNPVKFLKLSKGYRQFCCKKCANTSLSTLENKKNTMLERYGVENASQSKELRQKIENTMMERYGSKCNLGTEDTKLKTENTMMERYGVKHNFHLESSKEKFKKTMIEKYGESSYAKTDEFKEKYKQTCIDKYGVDNISKLPETKDKYRETCINKYGVDNASKLDEFKEKRKQTYIDKYGTDHPMKSNEIKNKCKQTTLDKYGNTCMFNTERFESFMLDKYNTRWYMQSKEFKLLKYKRMYNKLINSNRLKDRCTPNFTIEEFNGTNILNKYLFICTKCNTIFEDHLDNGKIPRCYNCYPIYKQKSNSELEVFEFIKQHYNNVISGDRTILEGKELDIYIPDINLAIEYNGLYYHQEFNGTIGLSKEYHINKLELCEDKNIKLIQIFDDEWINKQDIIKSILLSKINKIDNKLYARNCIIKEVNIYEYKEFLNNNHLQGEITSPINIGLYNNDTLISLLCIGNPRFNNKFQYEILRFCNKINTIITGGLSKLLKYFINNYNPNNIITYIDLRYGNGKSYINNGFIKSHRSKPNYYYTKDYISRESRYKYQKHKLESILESYDPTLTEYENMQLNGYGRIWDCGNDVLIWNK